MASRQIAINVQTSAVGFTSSSQGTALVALLAQTLPTCSRLRAFHPGKDPNRRLESARIAAVRELLDRRYGRARRTTEVILPENDIMLDDIDRRDRITERE